MLRNVFSYFVPADNLPVYGTAETKEMLDAIVVAGRPDAMAWHTIDPSSHVTVADQSWSFTLTDHPVETLGPRVVVGDKRFVFTSDSAAGWVFEDDGPSIDLAMMDASHLQDSEGRGIPHMSARECAVAAREAGVPRLVLTHLIPGSDPEAHRAEAEAAYGGPVEVALPGTTFTI